ncbi:hypothetical protein JRO89_XS04G0236800 [Xanthoceras sorbifolium]|uniref:STAS domain-containing protein n=1 Tax=Xanthoceras sorbifolium TaxID=99658 RepID=A0ABQ8I6S3_9ROSI|nr:hypothetical protein JRO89_XS04G0236800 [Xanthoceras sorbifolium]
MAVTSSGPRARVNFAAPRGFAKTFKTKLKETLFPDDPFGGFRNEKPARKTLKTLQYFVPLFDWLPKYDFNKFKFDLLAGITITSLAIPQGISYAKLANLPPIIGLYSSFVPPIIYAVFGSSKHLAVGTVAACSVLLSETIQEKVNAKDNPELYLHLVFTATFFTGIFETALGFLRLGILVDFLSHSTITGFMTGTAVLICLQQLKGMLGLKHFTSKTDVVHVLKAVFENRNEWRWECFLVGLAFLIFLQLTRFLRNKNPKLFWVSAMAPMVSVAIGCIFAYLAPVEKHGIQIVGELKRGINPSSLKYLNFDPEYLPSTIKAGCITGIIAMAEGMAIARSFAIIKNEQIDGSKEMVAFGFMNILGSFTSCYLTTGPFSKTAVNFNSGCKTQMANFVMAMCMMLVLLLLAPVFKYTPLVVLSAIIMSAMIGLISYEKIVHLFKVDKLDFCICMAACLGVSFLTMEIGLILSVGLAILRALLYVARPATCKLGKIPNSELYRDMEQYPDATGFPGILALQIGSPIYFANCNYIRERTLRWIRDEESLSESMSNPVEHVLFDLSGATAIDMTGIETLMEIHRILTSMSIKFGIVNPRIEILDKLTLAHFVDRIGKDSIYLSIDEAVEASRFSLQTDKQHDATS